MTIHTPITFDARIYPSAAEAAADMLRKAAEPLHCTPYLLIHKRTLDEARRDRKES